MSDESTGYSAASNGGNGRLPVDIVFDVLGDHDRRAVLDLLLTHQRPLTASDLARTIAERESNADVTELAADEVIRRYVRLVHVHLPKLAELGIVEYDRKRTVVEPTPRLQQFEPYLSPEGVSTE